MHATPSTLTRSTALILVCFVALACAAQTPYDRKIDIGGYKLHISEMGSGMPVVVFESGLGEDTATWSDVQPAIARVTRTLAYDRAGLGQSEASSKPRNIPELAAELHGMLHAAKVTGPYVLVGHSLGGAIVQVFAHNYPKETAALVLVDPEDGRLNDRLRAHMTPDEWATRKKALDEALPKFSPVQRAELEEAYNSSGKDLAAALPLPNVPVVLLTGTLKNPEFPGNPLEQDLKLELQNELLAKIPNSRHVMVPNSRHYIQNDAPQIVIDAIRDVLKRAPAGAQNSD